MTGKTKKPQVAAIGEIVSDILPDSRKLGGAPADFLHYAVKSGADGHLISAIGADDLGREVVAELNKFGIKPVLAITPYPTGRVLIFRSPSGGHTAHILENAAWDYIPYTEAAETCIKNADAVFFGTLALRITYSRITILDLIDCAPEKALKFFDINIRQEYYDKQTIETLLTKANILKLNTDELKTLKAMLKISGSPDDFCLRLKEDYGLKYLILTDMAKESRVYGDDVTVVKNSGIRQAFAFGAGNAFAGTFTAAVLKGASQQEAHETANQAAVDVCRANLKNA